MVPNAGFWALYFRRVHIRAIESLRSGVLGKVVPSFNSIAQEAEAAAESEFERLGAMPADPDGSIDMGDVAEWAEEHGIAYYEATAAVRQSILNLLAVGLYHLFEQQQLFFLRRELSTAEDKLFTIAQLEKRLGECGIDCRTFGCAPRVYELRQAANAIKHGPGPAAAKLATLRPDLFEYPVLTDAGWVRDYDPGSPAMTIVSWLFAPMTGSDLYVTERDLSDWYTAVIAYWEELSGILDEQARQHETD